MRSPAPRRASAPTRSFEPAPSAEACGLYLHVPFCAAICPYCDFAVSRGDGAARERFVRALVAEIGSVRCAGAARFDTVYLGGGTPSLLAAESLAIVLDAVRQRLPLAPDAFFVLEANPEDVDPGSLARWRELGIRGLSIGVQSFDDDALRRLGRRHGGSVAHRAAVLALAAGFDWVSLDLLYGAPRLARGTGRGGGRGDASGAGDRPGSACGELERALADLETAIALAPSHLSCYQLTVHAGTAFARARERGRLRELVEGEQAELFLAVHRRLAESRYEAYEASNFSRGRSHRSRHNTKYWRHVPYLGLGPSAHSFDGRARAWNLRDWRRWTGAVEAGRSPVEGEEELGWRELALESVMFGLRTVDGIDLGAYGERWNVDLLAANARLVESATRDGLLRHDGSRLRPTLRGLAVADALASSFALGPGEQRVLV